MNRSIEQYQKCVPEEMINMSEEAIIWALRDMRGDILKLHARLKDANDSIAELQQQLETLKG